jgi:hypothetical protein
MNRRLELPTSETSSRMPRLKNLAASPTCRYSWQGVVAGWQEA